MSTPEAGAPDLRSVRRVLFICLGNICRSPLAQGVMERLASERGAGGPLEVESRGTGAWHIGSPPDPRTIEVAHRLGHGLVLRSRGRVFDPARDLARFDLVLAMDRRNLADIRSAAERAGIVVPAGRIRLFREFDPFLLGADRPTQSGPRATRGPESGNWDVPDPYHGGPEGFDEMFRIVHRTCSHLLAQLFAPTVG